MAVIANVGINIDASSAVASLNAVSSAASKVADSGTQAASKVNASFKQLGSGLSQLKNAFSSLGAAITAVGLTAFASQVAKTGIEADRTSKRIANLTGSAEETARVQAIAANAAKQFGLGSLSAAKGVADLYARLAPMGIQTKQIETTFIGVNKAALQMNLSSSETANVMLQLSQALGSGVLQGDEFRSISEQMPPILDAVAKVLNVNRAELKAMGSDGKITTDILIQAMGELSKLNTIEPDSVRKFSAAMENLQVAIGTKLLPALTPLIEGLTLLLNAFSILPEPVQTIIVGLGALAAGIAILGPAISALITLGSTVGPALAAIASAVGALITTLIGGGGLSAAITAVITFFSGPAGWIVAIVAAGVALYAFRDQIGQAFSDIIESAKLLGQGIKSFFAKPFAAGFELVASAAKNLGSSIVKSLTNIWPNIIGALQNAIRTMLKIIGKAINAMINRINRISEGINRVLGAIGLPRIPLLSNVSFPEFAEGGYVAKPTTAIVGEGGEPEYIIPASKMADAMARYSAGARGSSVIPNGINPQVNIQTGPVMQMDGTNYVTQRDLMNATQSAARQGAGMALSRLERDPATRRRIGVIR